MNERLSEWERMCVYGSKLEQTQNSVQLGCVKAQKMNNPNLQSGHISDASNFSKVSEEKTTCGSPENSNSRISFHSSHSLLYFSFVLLCHAGPLLGHPQCLDYGPPFQPPFHLEFCSAYETFGCCDQDKDNSIAAKYWDIMDYIDPHAHKLCGGYIKDILCQVSLRWVRPVHCVSLGIWL